MRKFDVKVPPSYRFVVDCDGHCHEIASAFVWVEFNGETTLISKEGKKIGMSFVHTHDKDLFCAIGQSLLFYNDFGGGRFEWSYLPTKNSIAEFGVAFGDSFSGEPAIVVAKINERGDLRLLPEKDQKPIMQFQVTKEHCETYEKYKKRLKRHWKSKTIDYVD